MKSNVIVVNTSCTKYKVVKDVARRWFGWRTSDSENGSWDIFWTDTSINPDRLSQMKAPQKINHFPGMYSIARKNTMTINLNKLRKLFPLEYDFYPQSWVLPTDLNDFKLQLKTQRGTYIVKPEASSQGRGIYLVRKSEDITLVDHCIAQRYLDRPFLIDGFKFDLRLYVLVTGTDPLRIFLHEEGLVRLATEPYKEPSKQNLRSSCMHLTNYAVNKNNPKFISNEEISEYSGHKRSLSSFLLHLESAGHDVQLLWDKLCDLVVKTILVIHPSLAHIYNSCQPNDTGNSMCFEILGFDVFLDENLRPSLLEVNHSPSFTTDSKLDYEVKAKVIAEALKIMDIGVAQKLKEEKFQREISRMRMTGLRTFKETRDILFTTREKLVGKRDKHERKANVGYIKIYPSTGKHYEQFVAAAREIWDNFTNRNTRSHNREVSPESTSSRPPLDKKRPVALRPQVSPYTAALPHSARKSPRKIAWV